MRLVLPCLAAILALGLLGCSEPDILPADPNWKESVVSAMESTEGLASAKLGVNEVDDGLGHTGPVILGGVAIAASADPQTVVDALVANMCRVLGTGTRGIRVRLKITADGNDRLSPKDFGYNHASATGYCAGG